MNFGKTQWYLRFENSATAFALENELSKKTDWLPGRDKLLLPINLTDPTQIRVAIFGQDPYPNSIHATGIPFEVPDNIHWTLYPPTLKNIFREYSSDTKFPYPPTGSLRPWLNNGVFLWNVIPSCDTGVSLSHEYLEPLYAHLTKEIIETLQRHNRYKGGVIFVFLGARAREYVQFVNSDNDDQIIELSHPSPRGAFSGKHPFRGSRLFTTINAKLVAAGREPINWKLSEAGPYDRETETLPEVEAVSSSNPHIPPSKDVWREQWELIKPKDIEGNLNE